MIPALRILIPASLLAVPTLSAFEIRSYNAADHDRFTGTIAAPLKNPDQVFAHLDLTGVGWRLNVADAEFALVSRQHIVFCTHNAGLINNVAVRFLNSSNQLVSANTAAKVTITENGNPTDLTLFTLATPIDADKGVMPLPYLDLPTYASYTGKTIGIAGIGDTQNGIQVIGRDTLNGVDATNTTITVPNIGNLTTRYSHFSYIGLSGDADEGHFEEGDSGSPTFVETNGRPALVGVHSVFIATGAPANYQNYDVFVPHYITQLDAQMAPLGYRMRPVNAPATMLSGVPSVVESNPRRLHPLTVEFDIANTGGNLTGNLEVEFHFPSGQEPDSVSAAGWVTYGSGTKWTLRKATMAAAATGTLTASWIQAPAVSSLTPTIVWRSDTVADDTTSPSIALAPSYAEWAVGLGDPGGQDDPDDDGLVNLLEYAFGGDAENGALLDANGDLLLPRVGHDGGNVTFVFPERDDATARGLVYTVWYATALDDWTTTPPAGTVIGTAPHTPAIDGFVERSITWPDDGERRFVRVAVTLDE